MVIVKTVDWLSYAPAVKKVNLAKGKVVSSGHEGSGSQSQMTGQSGVANSLSVGVSGVVLGVSEAATVVQVVEASEVDWVVFSTMMVRHGVRFTETKFKTLSWSQGEQRGGVILMIAWVRQWMGRQFWIYVE